jgi:hypothetical protein
MTILTHEQLIIQAQARELAETVFKATAAQTDATEAYPWDNIAKLILVVEQEELAFSESVKNMDFDRHLGAYPLDNY